MCNGILFNHESEVRGPEFVTRKISLHVAGYQGGRRIPLELGNLDARKDWGYAKDYVDGMWKVLNYRNPDDFVLGTGEFHTVREFVNEAFSTIGVEIYWNGKGVDEVGLSDDGKVLVKVNRNFFRPLESDNYVADYSKAKRMVGWEPKLKFKELVKKMVQSDISLLK